MPLDRSISLLQITIYGVGVIVGAGIYALIGPAAGIAGNALWLAFVFAGIIAALTALSYAELGSRFPKEGAEALYVEKAFNRRMAAFFIGFISMVAMIVSSAAIAWGFATYFKLFSAINPAFIALAVIAICSLINYMGIQKSIRINNIFTIITVVGLLIIIVSGARFIGAVDLSVGFNGETGLALFPAIFSAAALIFFAFLGFDEITNLSEEIKSPKKNVPKAILVSLAIATVLYVLVAIVAVSVVPPAELSLAAQPDSALLAGPLALVANISVAPGFGFWLTIIALCATFNTTLAMVIASSRFLYGLSEQRLLPKFLSRIHPITKAPHYAIFAAMAVAMCFVAVGSLQMLGNLTTMGTFLMFFVVHAALLKLRLSEKRPEKIVPFNIGRVPVFALFGAGFCAYMFSTQFWFPATILGVTLPLIVFGLMVFATSIPIYWYFARKL